MDSPRPTAPDAPGVDGSFTARLGVELAERTRLARSFDLRRSSWRAGDVGRSVGSFAAVLGRSPTLRRSARTDVIPVEPVDDLEVRPPARYWPFEHDDLDDTPPAAVDTAEPAPSPVLQRRFDARAVTGRRNDKVSVLKSILGEGIVPEGWEDVLAAFLPAPEERKAAPIQPAAVHRAYQRAKDVPPRGLALVMRRRRTWAGSGTAPGATSSTAKPTATGTVADDRIDGSAERSSRDQRRRSARGGDGDAPGPRASALTAAALAQPAEQAVGAVLRRAVEGHHDEPRHELQPSRDRAAARAPAHHRADAARRAAPPTTATSPAHASAEPNAPHRPSTQEAASESPSAPAGSGARAAAVAAPDTPRTATPVDRPTTGPAPTRADAEATPALPPMDATVDDVLRPLRRSVRRHVRAVDPSLSAIGAVASDPILTTMPAPAASPRAIADDELRATEVDRAAVRPARMIGQPAEAAVPATEVPATAAPATAAQATAGTATTAPAPQPRRRAIVRRAAAADRARTAPSTASRMPASEGAPAADRTTSRTATQRQAVVARRTGASGLTSRPADASVREVPTAAPGRRRGAPDRGGLDGTVDRGGRSSTPGGLAGDAHVDASPVEPSDTPGARSAAVTPVVRRRRAVTFAVRTLASAAIEAGGDEPGEVDGDATRVRARLDGLAPLLRRVAPRAWHHAATTDDRGTGDGAADQRDTGDAGAAAPRAGEAAAVAPPGEPAPRTTHVAHTVRRSADGRVDRPRPAAPSPSGRATGGRAMVGRPASGRRLPIVVSGPAAADADGTSTVVASAVAGAAVRPGRHGWWRAEPAATSATEAAAATRAPRDVAMPRSQRAAVRRAPALGTSAPSALARLAALGRAASSRPIEVEHAVAGVADDVRAPGAARPAVRRSVVRRAVSGASSATDHRLPRAIGGTVWSGDPSTGAPDDAGVAQLPVRPAAHLDASVVPTDADEATRTPPPISPSAAPGERIAAAAEGDRPRARRRARRGTSTAWRGLAAAPTEADDAAASVRRSAIPMVNRRLRRRPRVAGAGAAGVAGAGVDGARGAGSADVDQRWPSTEGAPVRPAPGVGRGERWDDPEQPDQPPALGLRTPGAAAPSRQGGIRGIARRRRESQIVRRVDRDTTGRPSERSVAPRPPATPDALAERFLDELKQQRAVRPAPLPVAFRPLAELIVGDRTPRISTDVVSRRALDAVGKRAATTENVIHLAVAPHELRAPSKELAGVVAHELTHVAHRSPAPRFFDDHRDSAEERQAHEIGELIRRAPLAPRVALVPGTGGHMSTSTDQPAIRRSPSSGTLSAADLAAQYQGGSSSSSGTIRRAVPTLGGHRNRSNAPSSNPAPSDSGGSSSSASPSPSPSPSPAASMSEMPTDRVRPEDFERYLRRNIDVIMEMIEDRVMSQLDRRGGRFGSDF